MYSAFSLARMELNESIDSPLTKMSSFTKFPDSKSKISLSIEHLKNKELAYLKDGAVWLNTEGAGDDKNRVLIRDDGRATYFASDVAYHKDKIDRGFDKLIKRC